MTPTRPDLQALATSWGVRRVEAWPDGTVTFDLGGTPGMAYLKGRGQSIVRGSFFLDIDVDPNECERWLAEAGRPELGELQLAEAAGTHLLRLLVENPREYWTASRGKALRREVRTWSDAWMSRTSAAERAPALTARPDVPRPASAKATRDPLWLANILAMPPTNAWLLMGDSASYPTRSELAQMRRNPAEYIWTGSKQTQPGDLLFFYFVAPHRAIHFAARAATYPVFDPAIGVNAMTEVDANQWWIEHTPLVEIAPVPFSELRDVMGGNLILKGKPSHYLPPDVARSLMDRAVRRSRLLETDALVFLTPVGSPELPDPKRVGLEAWKAMADGPLKLERLVEQYVVEPLLRLSLPNRASVRWSGQVKLDVGVPDYVVYNADAPTAVVEVKLGVREPVDGDWSRSPDFRQVTRYSHALDVPAALVDCNRIFLINRGGSEPEKVIERHSATLGDLREVGRHLTVGPDRRSAARSS